MYLRVVEKPHGGAWVFNTPGNEGLQDIRLDEARGLVDLTNSRAARTSW